MNYATAEAEDNREKILKFIVKYIKRHCYPLATYEIAADTGLSKATVAATLRLRHRTNT